MSDGQFAWMLTLVVPLVAGVLIGRWRFLLAVLGIWLGIAVFVRENNGWYGYGWGDGGIMVTVLWASATVVLAAIGVGIRKATREWHERAAA